MLQRKESRRKARSEDPSGKKARGKELCFVKEDRWVLILDEEKLVMLVRSSLRISQASKRQYYSIHAPLCFDSLPLSTLSTALRDSNRLFEPELTSSLQTIKQSTVHSSRFNHLVWFTDHSTFEILVEGAETDGEGGLDVEWL